MRQNCRLDSIGFVKWAYFGSHGRDLVLDQGTAPGSAYHLVHRQEQEAEGGTRPVRSDNCVVGCGQDGRRVYCMTRIAIIWARESVWQ